MNPLSRIVKAVTGADQDQGAQPDQVAGQPATTGPAAASGDTATPSSRPAPPANGGQVGEASSGPSGLRPSETSTGGADAVPDTPDGVPEDYTH